MRAKSIRFTQRVSNVVSTEAHRSLKRSPYGFSNAFPGRYVGYFRESSIGETINRWRSSCARLLKHFRIFLPYHFPLFSPPPLLSQFSAKMRMKMKMKMKIEVVTVIIIAQDTRTRYVVLPNTDERDVTTTG